MLDQVLPPDENMPMPVSAITQGQPDRLSLDLLSATDVDANRWTT